MEFPPEILDLIRQFSRPYFVHFREYNRALRVHRKLHWPELKHALLTNNDGILDALFQFQWRELAYECDLYYFNQRCIDDPDIVEVELRFHKSRGRFLEIKETLSLLLKN
jgi:hypothetical protein